MKRKRQTPEAAQVMDKWIEDRNRRIISDIENETTEKLERRFQIIEIKKDSVPIPVLEVGGGSMLRTLFAMDIYTYILQKETLKKEDIPMVLDILSAMVKTDFNG